MPEPHFTTLDDLRYLMSLYYTNQNKIACIKIIRQISGEGLKESKNFLEQEWLPFVNGDRVRRTPQPFNFDQDAILDRLANLEARVDSLTASQTKRMAKGIFDDDET